MVVKQKSCFREDGGWAGFKKMRKPQRRQILKKVSGLDRIWIVGKESLLQSVSFGLV